MKPFRLPYFAYALALLSRAPSVAAPTTSGPLALCTVDILSLSFDEADGAFNGMSQAGALLVLRNVGAGPCAVPRLPALSFQDGAHRPLPLAQRRPIGVSHVAMIRVPLPEQAEATGKMHWVSGDVYDGHHCASAAFVTLTAAGKSLTVPFSAHLCGPAGKPIPYDLEPLKPDAVYRAAP